MKIAVFGSAQVPENTPLYHQAYLLGQLLGQRGHTILTGGYTGTMEAVSKGAAEAGAHVIGVTCEDLEKFRNARANRWVHEEWKYPTLQERLNALVEGGQDAAFALPGGAGTLAEIVMLWNRMLTQALPTRPLILIGSAWQTVFETLRTAQADYIPQGVALLQFAADVPQAVASLFDPS